MQKVEGHGPTHPSLLLWPCAEWPYLPRLWVCHCVIECIALIQCTPLQRIVKIYWPMKVSNEEVRRTAKMEVISKQVRRRWWWWIGHVSQNNGEEPTHCTNLGTWGQKNLLEGLTRRNIRWQGNNHFDYYWVINLICYTHLFSSTSSNYFIVFRSLNLAAILY